MMQPIEHEDKDTLHDKGFVIPKYDGECISNLPDTFAKLLNLKAKRPLVNQRLYDYLQESSIENLIFLLLDGFGANSVKYAREKSGFPSFEWLEQDSFITHITSVFPSTTSTATTTLHTGLTPQEHGVIGYTSYLREIGSVTQLLEMSPIHGRRSIFDLGLTPESFVGEKTIHERFADEGIRSNLYISKYIVGSGLSQITNRGANIIPILTSSDLFVKLRKQLEESRSDGSPSFHFAYFASPDSIAHSRGPFSQEYAAEIESVFHSLYRDLVQKYDRRGKKKTALLISADHGLAQIAKEDLIDLAHHKELLGQLNVPPTGDSRSLFLHAKSEKAITTITNYFASRFPNDFHVFSSKEVLKKGMLGRGIVKDEVYDRIGDVVIVPRGNKAIDNSILQPRYDYMPGRHGGLSRDEMLVPLIAYRL